MNNDQISAIDIIYSLPGKIEELFNRISALESANKMLEQKITALLNGHALSTSLIQIQSSIPNKTTETVSAEEDDIGEVMDIVTPAAPKRKTKSDNIAPFSLPGKPAPDATPSAPSENIKIPYQEVDLNSVAKPPAPQQTAVIVRGRLKERDGLQVNGVEIKIFDSNDVCVKKTKTASTGDWLAMLPPAEYTIEFSKPGMKPLMKTITVIQGRREMDVLI